MLHISVLGELEECARKRMPVTTNVSGALTMMLAHDWCAAATGPKIVLLTNMLCR